MNRRTLFTAATLVLLTSRLAPAQSDTPGQRTQPARASDQATLIRQENGWAAALVKRDRAYFEQVLADRFVYTENDRLMSRADVLRDATAGADRVTAAHNESMIVHLFGNTGVVTGKLIVSGSGSAGKFEHRYTFTDTWVKDGDGRWQIVAAQDYMPPAA